MNLPNRLTLLRLACVPFFMVFLTVDHVMSRVLALVLFVGASVTDLVDGYLARKYHWVTNLGVFLDPLADKLLITAAFIAFVGVDALHIPAWMVVLIVGREFLITGLRAVAASQGEVVAADSGGKFKTVIQITAIIVILVVLIVQSAWEKAGMILADLRQEGGWRGDAAFLVEQLPWWMVAVSAFFSTLSGIGYVRRYKSLLKE